MKTTFLRFSCLLGLLLVLAGTPSLFAQQPGVFPGFGKPLEHERNHQSVKSAFRGVVSSASKSTVVILSKDKQIALGTIVGSDGYVLTKNSELKGELICQFADGAKLEAKVFGIHDATDLAMLKVDAENLTAIQWRESEPSVGDWLATPGLEQDPVAIGVVSVGSRKISASSGILGILIEEGDKGPRIDKVMSGSGAEKAGLQVNDVIQSVNGKVMKTRLELINTVKNFRPGDEIRLSVVRGEETLSITATLGDRSLFDPGGHRQNFQNGLGGPLSQRRAGFPSALQHDSVLRPRDCGGPIVDLDGKAIGINIARAGRVSSYALPVSVIKPLLPDFLAGKFSPELAAKEKVEKLNARILALKTSQQELGKKVADFEQAIKKAKAAEDKAKKAFEQAQATFKKAQTEVANVEKNADAARIELTVAQSELKSVEAEKTALQKKEDEGEQ